MVIQQVIENEIRRHKRSLIGSRQIRLTWDTRTDNNNFNYGCRIHNWFEQAGQECGIPIKWISAGWSVRVTSAQPEKWRPWSTDASMLCDEDSMTKTTSFHVHKNKQRMANESRSLKIQSTHPCLLPANKQEDKCQECLIFWIQQGQPAPTTH